MSTFLRAGAAVGEFSDTERVVGEEEGRGEGRGVRGGDDPFLSMFPFLKVRGA